MPKITEPTVAEHRTARHADLISAGESVLRSKGLNGVTPRAVCEAAGLARTTFYDYFGTRDDLLVAIAIVAIERWNADVNKVLSQVENGLPALHAFIHTTMSLTAQGEHDVAAALREADLSPSRMEDLMTFHDTMFGPLTTILADITVASPRHASFLIQGLLNAGVALVIHGSDPKVVAEDVYRMVTSGLLA